MACLRECPQLRAPKKEKKKLPMSRKIMPYVYPSMTIILKHCEAESTECRLFLDNKKIQKKILVLFNLRFFDHEELLNKT